MPSQIGRILSRSIRMLSAFAILFSTHVFADDTNTDYVDEGNQLVDQVQIAKQSDDVIDAQKALAAIAKFQTTYSNVLTQSNRLALEIDTQALHEWLEVGATLKASKPTKAYASERIWISYKNTAEPSTAPERRAPKSVANDSILSRLFKMLNSTGSEALFNDLRTALTLKQSYLQGFVANDQAVRAEVKRLCGKDIRGCTYELSEWLIAEGNQFLRSTDFQSIHYRSAHDIASTLNREFADFNMNHVMTAAERSEANLWVRTNRLNAIYCTMMVSGNFTEDQDFKRICGNKKRTPHAFSQSDYDYRLKQYESELSYFKHDEARLKAYEPIVRVAVASGKGLSGDEDEMRTLPQGLRYFCTKRLPVAGFHWYDHDPIHRAYQQAYLKIAAQPDAILFQTDALKALKMQRDTLFNDASRCPDQYPVQTTEAYVLYSSVKRFIIVVNGRNPGWSIWFNSNDNYGHPIRQPNFSGSFSGDDR